MDLLESQVENSSRKKAFATDGNLALVSEGLYCLNDVTFLTV